MSKTSNKTPQEQSASWRVAHGPDKELRKQIRSRFRQLYIERGSPEGTALYEGVDSGGFFGAMCLNPEAARLFPELLNESFPWSSYDHCPPILHWGWVDGDERLRSR